MEQSVLTTKQLLLRPFELKDAKRVRELAGDWRVAQMTTNVPHPYEPGMAEDWIRTLGPAFVQGEKVAYAMVRRDTDELVGCISLADFSGDAGALGYWVGVPFWGRGYCTEAASALVEYGFHSLGLAVIYARYLRNNSASARVLTKIGFQPVGEVMANAGGMMRRMMQSERHR